MKRAFLALIAALLATGASPAFEESRTNPPSRTDAATLSALLDKASAAYKRRDRAAADFHVARYLGLGAAPAALEALFAKYPPEPAAFLSSAYHPSFLDWFESSTHARWGKDEAFVRERYRSVEIESVRKGEYFAALVARPLVEAWYTEAKASAPGRRLILALGSPSKNERPTLIAGREVSGRGNLTFRPLELDVRSHPLHATWPPAIDDLDGDGTPEFWLRYNLAWGNGFTQFLDVYRVKDGRSLELLRRFEGPFEGVARRLDDGTVQTAEGAASRTDLSHLEYDSHRIRVWKYDAEAKDFVKISEEIVPHLLHTDSWKPYFEST